MLSRFFERRLLDENTGRGLMGRGLSAFEASTGVTVTPLRALQTSAVLACVRVLAEGVASLPLHLYQRSGKNKTLASSFYLYSLLHDLPNPEMTSFSMREMMMSHLCLRGNALAYLDENRAGEWGGIWPISPDGVALLREMGTNRLFYGIELPDRFGREYRIVPAEKIWHVHGLSLDGLWGLTPIGLHRQAIGLALAIEEYGARFFGNGAQPGFVLKHPGKLKPDAYDRLKAAWENRHLGLENAHKIAILEDNMDVTRLGVAPDEAQFLETRKFQVTDIARIFRVPPHMIADLDRATFSNIEHMGLEFVAYSLMPWLIRFEQEIYRSLLTPAERKVYFAKFAVDALLRGDTQSRYTAYQTALSSGWLSINQVRELEDMNPIEEGDTHLVPLNMAPIGDIASGMLDASSEEAARAQPDMAFQRRAVERRSESGVYTTAMVAFRLTAADAESLSGMLGSLPEGGVATHPGEMHLTLAFLGEAESLDRARLSAAAGNFARAHAPIAGVVNGLGRFYGTEEGQVDAFYASFDAFDLARFRTDLVAALAAAGIDLASEHGFVPHITLAYLPAGSAAPAVQLTSLPLRFQEISLYWQSEVESFPLGGIESGAAGGAVRAGLPRDLEQRSANAARLRHRLSSSYQRVIRSVLERVARRETADILAQAKKSFQRRGYADFSTWLTSFYGEHQEWVERQMTPVLSAYADLVGDAAAEEIGHERQAGELDRFVRAYVASFAQRHVRASENRLRKLLERAAAAGQDPFDALQAELEEWEAQSPERESRREAVRANNAVAVALYAASSVVTLLRWVSFGESCPYCAGLNGRTVGIQESFLHAGQDYQPEGADRPLTNGFDVKHAPAHDGCDCMVVAGG